jgi:hypothetical protein
VKIFVLTAVAALAAAGAALATPPTHAPSLSGDFTLTHSCAFPVLVSFPRQNEHATTFSSGLTIVTGQYQSVLTNALTQKTISVNAPGPGKFTVSGDTLTIEITGPWVVFWDAGQQGPGTPGGMLAVTGKGTVTQRADGTFAFDQKSGTQTDLCAALGD